MLPPLILLAASHLLLQLAYLEMRVTLECTGKLSLARGSGDRFLQGMAVSPAFSVEGLSAKAKGLLLILKFSTGMGDILT